jgi:hypothetical protein
LAWIPCFAVWAEPTFDTFYEIVRGDVKKISRGRRGPIVNNSAIHRSLMDLRS